MIRRKLAADSKGRRDRAQSSVPEALDGKLNPNAELAKVPVFFEKGVYLRPRPVPTGIEPTTTVKTADGYQPRIHKDAEMMTSGPKAKPQESGDRSKMVSRDAEQVLVDARAARVFESLRPHPRGLAAGLQVTKNTTGRDQEYRPPSE